MDLVCCRIIIFAFHDLFVFELDVKYMLTIFNTSDPNIPLYLFLCCGYFSPIFWFIYFPYYMHIFKFVQMIVQVPNYSLLPASNLLLFLFSCFSGSFMIYCNYNSKEVNSFFNLVALVLFPMASNRFWHIVGCSFSISRLCWLHFIIFFVASIVISIMDLHLSIVTIGKKFAQAKDIKSKVNKHDRLVLLYAL